MEANTILGQPLGDQGIDDKETTPAPTPGSKRSQSGTSVFQFIKAGKEASHLMWKELTYTVPVKGSTKSIIAGITGQLRPGELTCILGPSGSGKTSLLNVLGGRVRESRGSRIGGQVMINGQPIEPSKHKHLFGYVMQEDSLFPTETPREILTLAARLRLQGVDNSQIQFLVDDMIKSLGLTKCADTMVGNEMIKGISGGEKKRTAVGVELITNPEITFLDEPTSGLDTAAAYKVVEVLKELTTLRQSVLCTIHQPSSEILHLFDCTIFIAKGQIIYQGKPSCISAHFAALGFPCPADYNPADFVLFLIETGDDATFEKIEKGWRDVQLKDEIRPAEKKDLPLPPPRKGMLVELSALATRAARNGIRDKASLGARYGSTIFLNALVGLIFLGACNLEDEGYVMQSHSGAVTLVGINAMFGCAQPQLLTFPLERPVFLREYCCQMYGALPYFFSKAFVEIPMLLLQVLLQWVIVYFLMGFNGDFLAFIAGTVLIGAASASTAIMVGCMVKDVKTAQELGPLLFVPQILFAGFFIRMEQVPIFLRWAQYLCSLKWGMNLLLLNEFDSEENPAGQLMLQRNDVEPDLLGVYVAILAAIFCGPAGTWSSDACQEGKGGLWLRIDKRVGQPL